MTQLWRWLQFKFPQLENSYLGGGKEISLYMNINNFSVLSEVIISNISC